MPRVGRLKQGNLEKGLFPVGTSFMTTCIKQYRLTTLLLIYRYCSQLFLSGYDVRSTTCSSIVDQPIIWVLALLLIARRAPNSFFFVSDARGVIGILTRTADGMCYSRCFACATRSNVRYREDFGPDVASPVQATTAAAYTRGFKHIAGFSCACRVTSFSCMHVAAACNPWYSPD